MAQKILIVDDDKDIIFMLKSALEQNGYEVLTAADGQQGLQALKTLSPDLIMADLTMPNLNGWNFTTQVRQDARFKNTPIIVLSALLQEERPPEVFEPGNLYIPKPFDIFEVVKKVKELLKDQ